MNKLIAIQQSLNCPKSQFNDFGKYKYRSCEDILEAVKPLLKEQGCSLVVHDELQECGGWVFVVAKAELRDNDGTTVIATAQAAARHEAEKKGMDGSQISGAASSYARKYALNGLFLIDDNKDSDATNTHGKSNQQKPQAPPPPSSPARITKADGERIAAARLAAGLTQNDVLRIASDAPFSCTDFPNDLLPKHVPALLTRIEEAGKDLDNA